jgi:hypothetical protein
MAMEQQRKARLQKARLMNCLQTILDLEAELRSIRQAESLLKELTSLRSIIRNLDFRSVRLEEDDVQRIEGATKAFLHELELHLQDHDHKSFTHGLLQ